MPISGDDGVYDDDGAFFPLAFSLPQLVLSKVQIEVGEVWSPFLVEASRDFRSLFEVD